MPFPNFFNRNKTQEPTGEFGTYEPHPRFERFKQGARDIGGKMLGGLATVWRKGKTAVNNKIWDAKDAIEKVKDRQHTRDWDTAVKGSMANGEKGILPAIHRFRGRAAARRMQRYNARHNLRQQRFEDDRHGVDQQT